MNIKTKGINYLIIFAIILVGLTVSSCIEKKEPYSPIKYIFTIETNEKAVIYLPVLLDLPNNSIADLITSLEVDKKMSSDSEVTYDVIDTTFGKALRINASGNVTLEATAGYEYYESHPEMPLYPFIPGNEKETKFFNLSMRINESFPYYFHWGYLETSNENQVKVQIYGRAATELGGEYWDSLPDGTDERHYFFTMKTGWQAIGFRRSTIYY